MNLVGFFWSEALFIAGVNGQKDTKKRKATIKSIIVSTGKGFIRAETVSYNDYIESGSEQASKANGVWRQEGKDYIVQEGDVIYFRFNI